jgi:hypothetical protein
MLTGVPAACERVTSEPEPIASEAAAAGLRSMIAIPLLQGGRLTAVMAWYF